MADSPQSIYVKNLKQLFGYPLRSPEPNLNLPQSHLESGLHIGDVGYVDNEGLFQVQFNICLPLDHELRQDCPGLVGLVDLITLESRSITTSSRALPPGREICHGAQRSPGDGQRFTSCSASGAILILPSGAAHQYLNDSKEKEFQRLAEAHAVRWCEFADRTSLYLITGFHKASSWHLASFSDTGSSGRVLLECDVTGKYDWYSGCDHRNSGKNLTENQTVFISGFKIEVRNLDAIRVERLWQHPSSWVSTVPALIWSFLVDLLNFLMKTIQVKRVSALSPPFHPADVINHCKMQENPNSLVAITHDNEWMYMLEENILPYEDMVDEDRYRAFLEKNYHAVKPKPADSDLVEGDNRDISFEMFFMPLCEITQIVITHIRMGNLAIRLKCMPMPVGFYVLIEINGTKKRTKCKSFSYRDKDVEWDDEIVLPMNLACNIKLYIVACFEFEPILGHGEILCHSLQKSVSELVDGSSSSVLLPLPYCAQEQEVAEATSFSALFITLEEHHSSSFIEFEHSNDKLPVGPAKETDKGHNALLTYHQNSGIEHLKECIQFFELAERHCHECGHAAYDATVLFNLATARFLNCQVHGKISDLDLAISSYRRVLDLRPCHHPDRPRSLLHLAQALLYRSEKLRRKEPQVDMDEIKTLATTIKEICPESSYDYQAAVIVLQTLKQFQVLTSGTSAELQELISELECQTSRIPPDWHFDRSHCLVNFGSVLRRQFEMTGYFGYLEKSISVMVEAIGLVSDAHHNKPWMLACHGDTLRIHFLQCRDVTDLKKSISTIDGALKRAPDGHLDKPYILASLGDTLLARFIQSGNIADIKDSISMFEDSLTQFAPEHDGTDIPDANKAWILTRLGVALLARFLFGKLPDFKGSVSVTRSFLYVTPAAQLSWLCNKSPSHPSESSGDISDLEQAISRHRDAAELYLDGHAHKPGCLISLASALHARFWYQRHRSDLQEAVSMYIYAFRLIPDGHPDQILCMNSLALTLRTAIRMKQAGRAVYLRARYNKLGAIEDLNEAICLNEEALLLRPQEHPDRSDSLHSLAVDLRTRYNKLGALEDLNEVIHLDGEALLLRPQGHNNRSLSLHSLAVDLRTRYSILGAVDDLNEAARLDREVLLLCPLGHSNRSSSLHSLAVNLRARYNKLGDIDDLDEAIHLDEKALLLRPQGHPNHSDSSHSLAVDLRTRYNKLRAIDDLDEAIHLDEKALLLRPQGHPNRSDSLHSLAIDLRTRYNRLRAIEDLNEAIRLDGEALLLRPQGHSNRSDSLHSLASFHTRFMHSMDFADREEIFTLYAQLADVPQMVSFDDISAARAWIRVAEIFHHSSTILAYDTCFRFLVRYFAILPPLPQHLNLIRDSVSSLAMDAFSACIRNQFPIKAVQLVEQGRGVFWSQLTRFRTPVDDIRASGPEGNNLANRFTQLATAIRNSLHSFGPDQHDRICRHTFKLQNVVESIRNLPGLSRFLLPSLFPELKLAASEGPIIIVNASKYGCDALVVLIDRDPIPIPLRVTLDDVQALSSRVLGLSVRAKWMEVGREFKMILRDIWDQVVSPIVDVLKKIQLARYSRIWWCPTAEFYLLPLHAAAPFRKGGLGLAHLYTSSYTPSLTALVRARRQKPSDSSTERKRFVAMGQANVIGESKLDSVGIELAAIGERISDLTTFTSMEGPDSCISRVKEELNQNEWVHIACHGIPNRERPFESAFALYDGRFTVQDIMQCELEKAEFAYLSVCQTTVGDSHSPDEMIHLASAMHFAGFRSVIGTMWALDDRQANKIVCMFYKNMIDGSGRLDYTRAAYALQRATNEVEDVTIDQRIVYVHIGA